MKASNVKAMRDALKETQSVIEKCMEILNRIPDGVEYDGLIDEVADELCDLRESHVNPSLTARSRNCDVGSSLEQYERFDKICSARVHPINCPLFEETSPCCSPLCYARWSQMPYEEEEVK